MDMKGRVVVMASLFVLTMITGATLAQAQQVMLVDVPFSFVAGSATLPAGAYAVGATGPSHTILQIKGQNDPNDAAILPTYAAQRNTPKPKPTLVFHRYGNQYFLSEIWNAGDVRGRQVVKSKAEKELVRWAKVEDEGLITVEAR
jgi:hypothetical protein